MRIWHLKVLVKSHKAQLEAMHKTKRFRTGFPRKSESASNTKKLVRAPMSSVKWLRSTPEQCSRALSGCPARSCSGFDRNYVANSARAVFANAVEEKGACSSSDFER